MTLRRPRGADLGRESESLDEEVRCQLILFSEWLELQGFSKEYEDVEGALTHAQLVDIFLGGIA